MSRGNKLELVYRAEDFSVGAAWTGVEKELTNLGLGRDSYSSDGVETSAELLREKTSQPGSNGFHVDAQALVADCGIVRNRGLALVFIETMQLDGLLCRQWIQSLSGIGSFIQAQHVDVEYDFWQNATDPLQYRSLGKQLDHAALKYDAELDHQFVDISANPGRRVLQDGYVEAVASQMWFGDAFWRVSKMDRELLLACDWLNCNEVMDGRILEVVAWPRLFKDSTGEEGAAQVRLRSTLYLGIS